MSLGNPPADATPVEVNGQVINPHETYAQDAKNTDYIVVTVRKILSVAEEDELGALSVTILEDLGDDNFLCHYPREDLEPIRRKEFVKQVDVYRNKFKIPAALGETIENAAATTTTRIATFSAQSAPEPEYCTVDILTHETIKNDEFESLKVFIAETSGVPAEEMEFAPGQVRLQLEVDRLVEIAQDDRVRIIEEVLEARLMSSDAYDSRTIVRGEIGITQSSYTGKGQIITVTDTGFDTGSREDCHPAFTGKVLLLTPLARSTTPGLSESQKTNDPDGHGTHVSGIIVGKDFSTTKGLIGGIAPDAQLIIQSCYRSWSQPCVLPANLKDLLTSPYERGSRIFSNSWGVGSTRGIQPDYSEPAKVIDNFIRDNPEVLICFSAGNDNLQAKGKPTIGLHAGAKNVLTVGATGNLNAPDEMYEKSSMGPSKQQRMKPDVVAPGVSIFAALSRGVAKYGGDAATAVDTPNVKWKALSGTSQATPLVAGCAAVLREALQHLGCTNPPGALLKALIINGADFLPGISTNAQGHGRVNLQASLNMLVHPPYHSETPTLNNPPPSLLGGTLIGAPLAQSEEFSFLLLPPSTPPNPLTSHPTHFKITLAYHDIGNKQTQNNLNLFVTDLKSSHTIPGNGKSLTDTDVQNNVEQIVLDYLPEEGVEVRVQAQKILAGSVQDYVIAWGVFGVGGGAVS